MRRLCGARYTRAQVQLGRVEGGKCTREGARQQLAGKKGVNWEPGEARESRWEQFCFQPEVEHVIRLCDHPVRGDMDKHASVRSAICGPG
jgi:hypothetical protein